MRKSMSKRLSILLSIVVMTSVLAGCGNTKSGGDTGDEVVNATGYPVVDEEIVINAIVQANPLNGDFNKMTMLTAIDEKTKVNMEFEQITSNVWEEQKNLILASGELPDVFMGGGLSDSDINKFGAMGSFIQLEDLIKEYAPNIQKLLDSDPKVKKSMTSPDGHIYTLPFSDNFKPENIPENLFINKKWLDKLGLAIPKTTDEFYTVMKAFKESDPNGNGQADEIPLTYRANQTFTGDYSLFGAFGTLDNDKHIIVKNDDLVFSPMSDEYKEGIKWMNKLYSEKLIDQEVFTQDQSQYVAKGKDVNEIVGSFLIYADENYVGPDRAYSDYIVLEPLIGPNGDQLWNRYDNNLYIDKFAITSSNKNPIATLRWADELFAEATSMEVHWGELGKNIELENGKYTIQTPPEGKSIDEYRYETSPGSQAPGVMTEEMYSNLEFAIDKQRKIERHEIYDKYATKTPLPVIRFTEEQQKVISNSFVDIDNYVEQMKAKWVTGESDIDATWDEYVTTLKKMNVEEYLKAYKEGYDSYK